jgi:hypothetical protein
MATHFTILSPPISSINAAILSPDAANIFVCLLTRPALLHTTDMIFQHILMSAWGLLALDAFIFVNMNFRLSFW